MRRCLRARWRISVPNVSATTKSPVAATLPGAADAYFAPVCMRIKNYALPVPGHVTDYIRRVCALPAVKEWVEDALAEKDFVEFDEPYRTSRT